MQNKKGDFCNRPHKKIRPFVSELASFDMAPNPPSLQQQELPCYTRLEVAGHKELADCWIIIHGEVYNVTSWLKRHPGGARLLMHYAGEDASVSLCKYFH